MLKSQKLAFSCLSIDFFYISRRISWNRPLIWVNQQNVKVICFTKIENWHVAEGTLYRFHSINMTISFDFSSVLIKFGFGNSLIKTYFEAKVIKSNWKLKTMLFFRIFWLYVQTMSSYHNVFLAQFFTKNSLVQI